MRKVLLALILTITCLGLWAQDFYDQDTVNEIRLYFTQANWDQLLDNLVAAGQEERLIGSAVINGVTYDSVGVRYKGNSTYSPNRLKNPFNIKLDYVIDGQNIGPYGTIKVSNGFMDPTLVREPLSYEIARKYFPASKSNYANIYVNDVLQGVYTNDEDLDDYFGDVHYFTGDNTRIKGEISNMTPWQIWGYVDDNPSSYANHYELDSGDSMMPFISFLNVFNNNPSQMETVLNVDRHLWFLAFENCFVNLDSPINNGQNYYVYEDINNRFNPVPWDLNECFGAFTNMQSLGNLNVTQLQNLDPLINSANVNYPIILKVLAVPLYKRMYIAHMRTMLEENITNNWYYTRAMELQTIVGPSVQADPNYLFTYDNFLNNINNSVITPGPNPRVMVGLTQLMDARATYLLNHAAFQGTVPTISATNYYPVEAIAYADLNLTVSTTDANAAWLGWRQLHSEPFQRVQMFDDGAHGDGDAGDGIFGVNISLGFGDIEYYAYAENSLQGVFYPARAAYEFMTIPVNTEPGELVINEIMAKNLSYPDPFGEMDDWVELYNPQNYAIDIGGMYMVDNHFIAGVTAWTQIPANVPTQTTIPPNGYLLLWFDENTAQGPLHINNRLGGAADEVYLIDSDGVTIIDTYSWVDATGLNVDDVSIGRLPDGSNTWQLFGVGQPQPCTPGSSNETNTNPAPSISNIQYSPNPSEANTPITISATVTDANNNLAAVELLWGLNDYTLHTTNMNLAGAVYTAATGTFALNNVLQFRVRATDALNEITLSPIYNVTIGFQSPTLYINEIMPSNLATVFDEAGDYEDWVEIYNPNSFPVNLAGYYMTDNHFGDITFLMNAFTSAFPDNTTIPGGGYKIVWFDEELTEGVLHVNTRLSASGDAVYLIAPDMLTVVDNAEWNAGLGLAADLSYGRYPNGTESWTIFGGAYPNPVTPGSSNSPSSSEDDNVPLVLPTLNMYPNPTRGILNIDLKNTQATAQIRIYNLKGQLIAEMSALPGEKAVWSGQDLKGAKVSSGIYLMKISAGKSTFTEKICVLTSDK